MVVFQLMFHFKDSQLMVSNILMLISQIIICSITLNSKHNNLSSGYMWNLIEYHPL